MKIEKLTENKIRIILNLEDLKENNIDVQSFMSNSIESQNLFINILDKAEHEVGFSTKDCKILIEALASSDGHFVFTITKYSFNSESKNKKKKLIIKKKCDNLNSENAIYRFETFEEFINYCSYINNKNNIKLTKLSTNISLYVYNNKYYLVINNINLSFPNLKGFYASLSEFGKSLNNSNNMESKLLEHGKLIIKNNAIKKCISTFLKNDTTNF